MVQMLVAGTSGSLQEVRFHAASSLAALLGGQGQGQQARGLLRGKLEVTSHHPYWHIRLHLQLAVSASNPHTTLFPQGHLFRNKVSFRKMLTIVRLSHLIPKTSKPRICQFVNSHFSFPPGPVVQRRRCGWSAECSLSLC